MRNFLENLRKKPEHVRRRITLVTTVVCSFFVVFGWWSVWNSDSDREERNLARDISKELSPLDGLAGTFRAATEGVTNAFTQLGSEAGRVESAASGGGDVVYPEEVFESEEHAAPAASSTNE